MANLLDSVYRLVTNPVTQMRVAAPGRNRINSVGYGLEGYIKDLFADSFGITDENALIQSHSRAFSYIGNQNNPPDLILSGGDAIETKKIESSGSALALNSSYPKSKLFSNDRMILPSARDCEAWVEKDMIYAVGHTSSNEVKMLWLVYGDCFAADKEVYERIKRTISEGVNEIPNVEFAETNELGRVNKVDPLGITHLRIRGMWGIDNPRRIFSYLNLVDRNTRFQLIAIMKVDKFNSFPEDDQNRLRQLNLNGYSISQVTIKDPNNPANLIGAKLINFKV